MQDESEKVKPVSFIPVLDPVKVYSLEGPTHSVRPARWQQPADLLDLHLHLQKLHRLLEMLIDQVLGGCSAAFTAIQRYSQHIV